MSTLAKPSRNDNALIEFDALARLYAEERATVAELAAELNDAIRALQKKHLPAIKRVVAKAMDAQGRLEAAVAARPDLFVQPRTITLHGIKFGYGKGRGAIEWDCEDSVLIARIRKLCTEEEAELLIRKTEKPLKDGLKGLEAALLAKLGVKVEATGDVVVIRGSDSEVDKLVERLLKEGAEVAE